MEERGVKAAPAGGPKMGLQNPQEAKTSGQPPLSDPDAIFRFSSTTAFCVFAFVNILAAIYAPIQDCDEVFNYWEPTHYLSHGFGLQTWEYSPEYAIRSWLYVVLHAIPGKLGAIFFSRRSFEFYCIRTVLACVCAGSETRLFSSISRAIGPRTSFHFMMIMATAPGMFHASVAYLPSSFSMYTSMIGFAAFIDTRWEHKTNVGMMWFGIGATVGWPFSAALITPLFSEELICLWLLRDTKDFARRILDGVLRAVIIVPFQLAVDLFFYHKVMFVPWRIVSYNIFSSSSRGPDIFGTEPWHFYIRNLLLNFNAWFLLALCAAPLMLLHYVTHRGDARIGPVVRTMGLVTPFYLWLATFSAQAHKEERFMYPVYPFLCFNAAVSLHQLLFYLGRPDNVVSLIPAKLKLFIVSSSLIFIYSVSFLRTVGIVSAYGAPLRIYTPLQNPAYADMEATVCLGKEWYRFPSSYFLPNNMRVKFVKSAFDGLLPGQFSEATTDVGRLPTWLIPPGMNDQNIEDPGKHVDIGHCHFLVDSYFPGSEPSTLEPNYIENTETWEPLQCSSFLDASRTHPLSRIFFVPEWSIIPTRYRRQWGQYCLLRRKSTTDGAS